MRVLVTGGCGFIGSHVVDRFFDAGYEVEILDNFSTGKLENNNKPIKIHKCDIIDFDFCGKEKYDIVCHLAAQVSVVESENNPENNTDINITSSVVFLENYLKSHKDLKYFIFASTAGAIYNNEKDYKFGYTEQSKENPLSHYGVSKLCFEKYLKMYNEREYTFRPFILRLSNVYGPRQDSNGEAGVVSKFIDAILNNKVINLRDAGEMTRDFVYVKDVANAFFLAAEYLLKHDKKQLYKINISSWESTKIKDLLYKIVELTKKDYCDLNIQNTPALKGEIKHSLICNLMASNMNWDTKYNLTNGLKETIEWSKSI